MDRFLAWLDQAMYRWGQRPYSWVMRAKGYRPVSLDEYGMPECVDEHAAECWFVPDVPGGTGWVKCAPGCVAS